LFLLNPPPCCGEVFFIKKFKETSKYICNDVYAEKIVGAAFFEG
jgi:hypothetical protein